MSQRITGRVEARGLRFAIIASRFNELITTQLVAGARDALVRHGAAENDITEIWVPGAWELPMAARAAVKTGRYDALVCLGCVIRGETTHHEHVGGEASSGLARVSLDTDTPIGFGVLTTNTVEQAIERAGTKSGNKGADAAVSAIEMVTLLRELRQDR